MKSSDMDSFIDESREIYDKSVYMRDNPQVRLPNLMEHTNIGTEEQQANL